jgi:hypothetical protein
MATVDKSQQPFYDDYDENKQFYNILFRPKYAVQTRELNQIQTMFQKQIERLGDHLFEDGSIVIPGEVSYDLNYSYATVSMTLPSDFSNFTQFVKDNEVLLRGPDTGLIARVVNFVASDGTDPDTMYLMYLNGGTDKKTSTFPANENVKVYVASSGFEITRADIIETGVGSKITVNDGVYYLGGKFVLVPQTTIPLDKYSTTPTKVAGFVYEEELVTPQDDSTLYDNAQGTPNFSAPGAYRLYVNASLRAYDSLADAPDDFAEIFRIEDGRLQKLARGPSYNVLADTLAKRTYDESGNYEVDGFPIDVREHLKEDNNRGLYTPVKGGDESKFVASIGNGLAYVKGYESSVLSTQFIDLNKARSIESDNNFSLSAKLGYFMTVDSITNIPSLSTYQKVEFYDAGSVLLGNGRIKSFGVNGTQYDMYLFDIRNTSGDVSTSFISDVREIRGVDNATAFTATVTETNAVLKGTDKADLMYSMSYEYISSLVSSVTGESDTSFTVIKQFETTTDASGDVTLSADANETFLGQVTSYSIASFTDVTNDHIDISGISTLGGTPTGKAISIAFGVGYESRPVRVNVLTSVDEAVTKNKTVSFGIKTGSVVAGRLNLGKADGIRINTVVHDGEDVTASFTMVKNSRPSYYGVSYVTTKETFVNPVTVNFEYFNHSSGNYFCVDSYSTIDYKDIPFDNGVRLSDVLDFRPRIDDTGANFTGAGSSRITIPAPNTVMRVDLEYYVPRKDKIVIKKDGILSVVEGTPDLNPEYPATPTNSMSLYEIDIPAYTLDISSIRPNRASIKRYTMDDIGRLENRLDGLEYYVSLSLLEKDAADMQVIDPVTGLNRFKSGILVDPFDDHGVGDHGWDDYHCSIGEGQLRPEMKFNAVDFGVDLSKSTNVRINDGIATLDYTEEVFLEQNARSAFMNVNPYAVFRWEGEVTLSPSVDNWVDVVYTAPRVVTRSVTRFRDVTTPSQSWQNNATVLSSSSSSTVRQIEPHALFNNPVANDFGAANTASRTTTTTTNRQLQNTSTSASSSSGGERVMNNEWLPFMRSRDIEVTGEGHKPETKLNFFFDNNNINQYVKPISGSFGGDVVTGPDGDFTCVFNVPNDDELQIPVGTKLFVATDTDDNRRELALSYGEADYTATSRRETRQRTVVRTVIRTVERASVTSTNANTTTWYDPLAQSFLVEEDGGIFVTKCDLFFLSKDSQIPVHIDIREMENGMPTQRIIAGSKALLKSADVIESEDGSVPSTFNFKYPVYLEEGREYCIMIWANSIDYNVFVANLGEKDLGTGKYIANQPYLGVLFKSQNSSTWTADQNADLQFVLHRAKFNTAPAVLHLENQELPRTRHAADLFVATTGSSVVRVNMDKHNMVAGSILTITKAVSGKGFSDTDLNKGHVITSVIDANTLEIDITGVNATGNGLFGGVGVETMDSIMASFMNLNCNDVVYSGTEIRYDATGMTGESIDGTETAYQTITSPIVLEKGGMKSLKYPWMITNKADEAANFAGNASMIIKSNMKTNNSNVSPVIDLYAFNLIAPTYLVDGKVDDVQADGSNCFNKYRTNVAGLVSPATSIRVFVDTIFDEQSDVILSCRVGNSEDEVNEQNWKVLNNVGNVINTNNAIEEIEYFLDTDDGLPEYSYFQVMVQMKTRNNARVPICRNLRVVALGT